ncbi:MAG: hypothetical protein AABW48_05655 [Nanoarchaeota archaeon]
MNKKRGMLVVVLLLFLVVLSSSGLGIDINDNKYVTIGYFGDDGTEVGCDTKTVSLDETKFSQPGKRATLIGDDNCNLADVVGYEQPPSDHPGCWFLMIEDEAYPSDDEGLQAILNLGTMFDSIHSQSPNAVAALAGWSPEEANCGEPVELCQLNSYTYQYSNALICSNDRSWHKCTYVEKGEDEQGTLAWANDKVYECTKTELSKGSGYYVSVWKALPGTDYDKDGYTDEMGDCANGDPKDPNTKLLADATNPDLCPPAALDEEGQPACVYPDNSKCAICINPGAPEVCGDELNNDCLTYGTPSKNSLIGPGLLGDTPDDCHNNKAACMQEPIDPVCAEELCEPDEDGKVEKDCEKIICTEQKNIFDEKFSWIQTGEDEGYCCGFSGVGDLGVTREGKGMDKGGQFICLNKNEDLVGMEQDKKWGVDIDPTESGEPSARCPVSDGWCWLNAFDNAKYNIFTLKKPGKPAFDIVSNNNNWHICNATTSADPNSRKIPIGKIIGEAMEEVTTRSNHYYCYKEGEHYSWAECAGKVDWRGNVNIKGRLEGEGLFTLPLRTETAEGMEEFTKDRYEHTVEISADWYKTFYGDNFLLDFSGYDYLNFMVRFATDEEGKPAEIKDTDLPLDVLLTIAGPDDQIYFNKQKVLSYVINNPFFSGDKDQWMHVRVPLSKNLKNIQQIHFEPNSDKLFLGIRNIYLSKAGEESLLCSGIDSQMENNWITDADDGPSGQTNINGMLLCQALYGKNAWLGYDDEIDQSERGIANCCGNDPHEYYAGSSPEQEVSAATEEASATFNQFGCWNSEVIASGTTAMNVEFEVEYWNKQIEYAFKNIELPAVDNLYYQTSPTGFAPMKLFQSCKKSPTYLQPGRTSEPLCTFSFSKLAALPGKTDLWFKAMESADQVFTAYAELVVYDLLDNQPVGKLLGKGESILDDNEVILVPPGSWYIDSDEAAEVWNHPLAVVARLKEDVYFPAEKPMETITKTPVKQTYSCNGKDKCTFPLPDSFPPGNNPKYKITNSNPELYELYFITVDEDNQQQKILVTLPNQEFNTQAAANLQVQKVAQQILFFNKGADSETTSGFYGCQAASFLEQTKENLLGFSAYKNLPYCSVVDKNLDFFCAYSVEKEFNEERFTTINSWSNEEIKYVGYDYANLGIPEADEDLSLFYEQAELTLKEENFPARKRNFSASVLPARNFLSNPEFETQGAQGQIPHWDIFKNNELVKNEEHHYVDQETRILSLTSDTEKLRSERIAVPKNSNLHFSQTQPCKTVKVFLFDKDGKATGNADDLTNIQTDDASYLMLEFTGGCKIEKPVLQLKDAHTPVDFSSFKSQEILENFNARSGQACCPQDFCWNGYACVKPMTESTFMTEFINEERNYRCIAGKWVEGDVKRDWNDLTWGFCKKKDQCLVLPTGKEENTAKSFYEGKSPLCIDTSQYILDHYCDKGNWTSRTKFIASKLIEVAEDEDYVLYCAPYPDALLEFKNEEDYIGGDFKQQDASKPDLGEISKKPQLVSYCFNTFKGVANLVPIKENTCVNNICVLKYKEGKQSKVAFATTLNRDLGDPKSFLNAFLIPAGISSDKIKTICKNSQPGKFTPCDLSGLNLPNADLFYSQDLNALIYAKDGLNMEPGMGKKITQWFANLFGLKSKLSDETSFLTKARNFRDIYILKQGEKKVRAVKEVLSPKQTLIAEYDNFKTPVCDYVNNIKLPLEAEAEPLEIMSEMEKIACSVDGSKQKVELVAGLDFFWPQLTGKLRVS